MIPRKVSDNKIINIHVTSGPKNCNLGPKFRGILPVVFGNLTNYTCYEGLDHYISFQMLTIHKQKYDNDALNHN